MKALTPGLELGARFVLVRRIGRGGSAEVWLATDRARGERVALKFLDHGVAGDAARLARLEGEVAQARRLPPESTVATYGLEQQDGHTFLVMEFLEGGDLGQMRGRSFESWARAADDVAAAEKTLEILDETPALATIAEYGTRLRAGMSQVLSQRGIKHSFSGHPSMSGLFFAEKPPRDYRDWVTSDYTFYEALAPRLHDLGVLCEPDSREPWFICEAHDDRCLGETLERFETAVNAVVASARPAAKAPFTKYTT